MFLNKMNRATLKTAALVVASAMTLLTACGGDGSTGSSGSSGGGSGNNSLAMRALPASYTNAKATNYSAYRAGGPNVGEVPTVAQITQDLTLLQAEGYTLLRLFGADAVSTSILSTAQANFPSLKFQIGIYLEGAPSTCVDAVNTAQIQTAITQANTYTNVATVSVGNETSFANNLPVSCLASYITTVKKSVTQPVTADDDYTFYAGLTASGEKPDTILPLLDFASIHTYPLSNSGQWNWTQTTVAAGQARAVAMMNAATANAQATYTQVFNYPFTNSAGQSTTIGAAMPIVIGETGWKAVQTNSGSSIEKYTATPINQKYYIDQMTAWQAAGTGPKVIFNFEAFDEAWKGTDDGWGVWNSSRAPRYALCGTTATNAPTCTTPDAYAGMGYYTGL